MDATHWLNALRVIHSMGFFPAYSSAAPQSHVYIFKSGLRQAFVICADLPVHDKAHRSFQLH